MTVLLDSATLPDVTNATRPLTAQEVADRFAVSVETVNRWADTGKLVGFQTPTGRWRFRPADIEGLIAAEDAS